MRIDFNDIPEAAIPHMNGGDGSVIARMHDGDRFRVIVTRMPAGSSIGLHEQASGDDINYVMEGRGRAVCDGAEEPLFPGVCHICPKGSSHTIINDGDSDLVLFTVVSKRRSGWRCGSGELSAAVLPVLPVIGSIQGHRSGFLLEAGSYQAV